MGELAFLWLAAGLYAASTLVYVGSSVFGWRKGPDIATWLVAAGLLPQLVGILIRWNNAGHGPYMSFFEMTTSNTFVALAIFAFVAWRLPSVRSAGIVVVPVSLLVMSIGMAAPRPEREVIPLMKTFWLGVHVSFAKLAYGAYLLSFGLAVLQLRKSRKTVYGAIMGRLPSTEAMEDIAFSAIGFGMIMHSVMIFSGSIWANEAWGSYWSWEPLETWTTFSWIIYGIVLHLRRMHGWRGNRAAWAAIAGMGVVLFTSFGVLLLFQDGHSPFLRA